jgi:hypothetical protein
MTTIQELQSLLAKDLASLEEIDNSWLEDRDKKEIEKTYQEVYTILTGLISKKP